jgi:hypothetical protein
MAMTDAKCSTIGFPSDEYIIYGLMYCYNQLQIIHTYVIYLLPQYVLILTYGTDMYLYLNGTYTHLVFAFCGGGANKQKTKPTQHTVQVLRSLGLMPNLLACRSTVSDNCVTFIKAHAQSARLLQHDECLKCAPPLPSLAPPPLFLFPEASVSLVVLLLLLQCTFREHLGNV